MANNNDIDLLAILSVMLGVINVQENRLQSAQNDVQSANDRQAQYMLEEINKKFDEQNIRLDRIEKIIEDIRGG